MNDPKYPQWNARIKKWDILLSSMTRELGFVTYVSVFNASKNAVHLDNTHLHHTFYIKLKKMIIGYFKPLSTHTPKQHTQGRSQKYKQKTVIIIGKGESAKPVTKTKENVIVTVNHALAFQNYSDLHVHLDWYFNHVPPDFFCRAKALLVPTYFHVNAPFRPGHFVHASLWLSKLKFEGPIFLVQLPDGPKDPAVAMWSGKDFAHSSGDMAFAWMLKQGYRKFESYGIGGQGYTNLYISNLEKKLGKRFTQNAAIHTAHIKERFVKYKATWVQHLQTPPTWNSNHVVKVPIGSCISPSSWGNLKEYGPSIIDAPKYGGGDPGVPNKVFAPGKKVAPRVPRLKSVIIVDKQLIGTVLTDSMIVSVDTGLNGISSSAVHFQFWWDGQIPNISKAGILVVPTYYRLNDEYFPIENALSNISFPGMIFKVQLKDGPQQKYIPKLDGNSSVLKARNWMFSQGYRQFYDGSMGTL
jgi:hypothetical protein